MRTSHPTPTDPPPGGDDLIELITLVLNNASVASESLELEQVGVWGGAALFVFCRVFCTYHRPPQPTPAHSWITLRMPLVAVLPPVGAGQGRAALVAGVGDPGHGCLGQHRPLPGALLRHHRRVSGWGAAAALSPHPALSLFAWPPAYLCIYLGRGKRKAPRCQPRSGEVAHFPFICPLTPVPAPPPAMQAGAAVRGAVCRLLQQRGPQVRPQLWRGGKWEYLLLSGFFVGCAPWVNPLGFQSLGLAHVEP